jgi:septal ring factor EnvC (AmiA/AmiB activator)
MEPIVDVAALRPVLDSLRSKGLIISLTREGRGHVLTHALYQPRELERLQAEFGTASADQAPFENRSALTAETARATVPVTAHPAAAAPTMTPSPTIAAPATTAEPTNSSAVNELRNQLRELQETVAELQAEIEDCRREIQDLRQALGA